MDTDFTTLIGRFIHHCGSLEFFTNNAIKSLATNTVLSADAIHSPFFKRIELLRRLLRDRSALNDGDIDSLCDELNAVRKHRNAVAHNPIVSEDLSQAGSEVILVQRRKPEDISIPGEMTRKELANLVDRTNKLMIRFVQLVPDSTIS